MIGLVCALGFVLATILMIFLCVLMRGCMYVLRSSSVPQTVIAYMR